MFYGSRALLCCNLPVGFDERTFKLSQREIPRLRSTLIVVGLPSPELEEPLDFNASDLIFSELTIKGSLVANKELLDEMLEFVAKHDVHLHNDRYSRREA